MLFVLGGLGVVLAGAIVGTPILLIAAAIGVSLDEGLKVVAYSSPLWAPIGAGMGMFLTNSLMKGLRSVPPV